MNPWIWQERHYTILSSGKRQTNSIPIDKLVLKYFKGIKRSKKFALHLDFNKLNDKSINLDWSKRGDLLRYYNTRKNKIRGIYPWRIGKKKFRAVLKIRKKVVSLGYFNTYDDALKVYLDSYTKAFGYLPFI